MLHLKQRFSPFSLFVLGVVFFVLAVSFLIHLSRQYFKGVHRLVFQRLRVFTSWNSFSHKVPWKNLILKTSRELVFIAKYDHWKNEFELLKSELVFYIWVSENYHYFKILTKLNVSNCSHKWPKIGQKIFQVLTVKCFSLLDDSSLQFIDSGRPLTLTLLEEI